MTRTEIPKKPVSENQDWHPADIKAALEKAGWSMRRLAKHYGHSHGMLTHAMRIPYPRAEQIIAKAIGVAPETIWPSRYDPELRPKRRGAYRPIEAPPRNHDNESAPACNDSDEKES